VLHEQITWYDVTEQLPDADLAVLINAPGHREPVWLGFYDGVFWFDVNGGEVERVERWAELPKGGAA
jgi:hypothetical protein